MCGPEVVNRLVADWLCVRVCCWVCSLLWGLVPICAPLGQLAVCLCDWLDLLVTGCVAFYGVSDYRLAGFPSGQLAV